jgi:hypothetical protein
MDPWRAPHFGTASPIARGLGDFLERGLRDMNFSAQLMDEVQASDTSEGNQGAGVEDENHCS